MPPSIRPVVACLAALGLLGLAAPARAETLGIRPLGGDYESARTVGIGNWAIEGGAWAPSFGTPTAAGYKGTEADLAVLSHWQTLPAWPTVRAIYGLKDGNEAVAMLGPIIGGGYRKFFLRAEAPWPGEYLQVLVQLGGGLQLSNYKTYGIPVPAPMGYVRIPAIFEAGPVTVHVAGGGYYLFNNQPMVEADAGLELTPFDRFQFGGHVKLRMDSTKITPTDGTWSLGGGVRYQLGARMVLQADFNQDAGPPVPANVAPFPFIEFPYTSLTATVGYYF